MDSDREIAERRLGQHVGGKWRLDRLLGTGGMAAVYAASAADGSRVALKMLHPEMTLKRDVRERFVREAYVGNRVQHDGAVRILEHGESEGEAFLVMELLEGEPLGERVRRLGVLPLPELLNYLDQVLDVLVAAHAQGIIHRDIKPDNLFVGHDGRIKILDFGLARMLDDVPGEFKTRTGLALGTLPYMAPEQALGKRAGLDGRVDLFALGATAFRILAKRRVHEADSEAELLVAMATQPVAPLGGVAPDVPPHVCAIVDHSLAFNKDARYPDARTMQADVRAVLAGQEPAHALRALASGRDMPTRVERAAPVVAGAAFESPPASFVPSARGTAVMPTTAASADAPTRVDAPAAVPVAAAVPALVAAAAPPSTPPPAFHDAGPASAALAQTNYGAAPLPVRPLSNPPPAQKSMLPLVLVLASGALVLGIVGVGGALVLGGAFESESAAATPPPATANAGTPPTDTANSEPLEESPEPQASASDGTKIPAAAAAATRSGTTQSPVAYAKPTSSATSATAAPAPAAAASSTTRAGAAAPPAATTPAPPAPTQTSATSLPPGNGKGRGHEKQKDKDKGKGKDK